MMYLNGRLLLIFTLFFLLQVGTAVAGGWLGVTLAPPQGVQVAEIFKDSPADQYLIKKGDVILKVGTVTIRSISHFNSVLELTPAGQEVLLVILRKGEAVEVPVTLENSDDHQSFPQSSATLWRQSQHGSLMPPVTTQPLFPTGSEQGLARSRSFLPEEWSSYRPPQERRYRPLPPAAWLGIAPGPATNGVAVMGVAPNSPAEQAELQEGDVITAINRQNFTSPGELVRTIGMMQPGDLVEISFFRDGRTHMLQVPLQRPPIK